MSISDPGSDVIRVDNALIIVSDRGLQIIANRNNLSVDVGVVISRREAVELAQEILRRYDVKDVT